MPIYLYVSLQDDDRISVYTMDAASGRLEHQRDETVTGGPAALATDPERKFLYVGRRGIRELSSFGIDQNTGGLSILGTASLEGEPVSEETARPSIPMRTNISGRRSPLNIRLGVIHACSGATGSRTLTLPPVAVISCAA